MQSMPAKTVEKPRIPRPVWFLGWTSLFTDAANEAIYPLLPVYLSRVLGATAVSLGIIEGVAEGLNSLLKVISGYWSDRRAHRRPIVIGGYALSSFSRPLIALTTSWPQVLLKFVLSQPAVTCAIPGTRRREHMEDNVRAGFGEVLPPGFWKDKVGEVLR